MLLSPQILIPNRPAVVVAGAAATTWNSGDKTSGLTLSNGSRTVIDGAAGNTNQGIRSVANTTTNQKVYIEHTVQAITSTFFFGFATSAATLSSGPSVVFVSPTRGFGFATDGKFYDQDSADTTLNATTSFTVGDRLGIAYDSGAGKAWLRKNGGTFNVSNGGGDPVAGTGGFSVVLTGSPFFAWVGLDAFQNDQFTTNFASTDWVDAAPSGYTQLA